MKQRRAHEEDTASDDLTFILQPFGFPSVLYFRKRRSDGREFTCKMLYWLVCKRGMFIGVWFERYVANVQQFKAHFVNECCRKRLLMVGP